MPGAYRRDDYRLKNRKALQPAGQRRTFMICAASELPSWPGILSTRKVSAHRPGRLTTLFAGSPLERGRAAPAEGVHRDEVRHEAARSKFEAVWIFTIAAMFLLIPHQTAPLLLHGRSASANALRGAVCTLESSNAREKRSLNEAIAAGFFRSTSATARLSWHHDWA